MYVKRQEFPTVKNTRYLFLRELWNESSGIDATQTIEIILRAPLDYFQDRNQLNVTKVVTFYLRKINISYSEANLM